MYSYNEAVYFVLIAIVLHLLILCFCYWKPAKKISGRHVTVTGGSSGIGLHVAIECARRGAHVTLIARNKSLLEKAVQVLELNRQNAEQKFNYKSLDISSSYEQVEKCLQEIENDVGPIYMLVNCAGFAVCGVVEEITIADAKRLMDVNYYGTYYCTRYVLPKMKTAQEGIIVITASQAALLGIYGYGPYAAAKFALRGLAETIAMESKHLGLTVTLALPSDTNTPGFENEEKTKPRETKIISGSGGLAKPEDVAKQIVVDALKGKFFSIYGLESWIVTTLCCGMAPWGGPISIIAQFLLMGPLRLIGLVTQWNFSRIVKNCSKSKSN